MAIVKKATRKIGITGNRYLWICSADGIGDTILELSGCGGTRAIESSAEAAMVSNSSLPAFVLIDRGAKLNLARQIFGSVITNPERHSELVKGPQIEAAVGGDRTITAAITLAIQNQRAAGSAGRAGIHIGKENEARRDGISGSL